jgi:hypothetical protein
MFGLQYTVFKQLALCFLNLHESIEHTNFVKNRCYFLVLDFGKFFNEGLYSEVIALGSRDLVK